MNNAIIAINIITFNKSNEPILTNKNFTPILFYWNGEGDIIDKIKNEKQFIDFIKMNLNDCYKYSNSKIIYSYFKEENNEEKYETNNFFLQDLILPDEISEEFQYDICLEVSKKVYETIFNAKYRNPITEKKFVIYDIYDKIMLFHKNTIGIETYKNYARKIMLEELKLNQKNAEKLSSLLIYVIDERKKYSESI